jgi:hypothetical protein
MIELIKIERDKTAPRRKDRRIESNWKLLFDSMKIGDWFVVDKEYHPRIGASANIYLKGKYTFYMHPEEKDKYVFLRIK